jgi:anaerobic magnesium-protoporphyrin IX monomethyl ester cyclase
LPVALRIRRIVYLIVKPFLGKRRGATPAEKLSRAIEYPEFKDSASALTLVADEMLEQALAASKAQRDRLQPDS